VASSAKLAINYLLGLNLQGIAETVLFAEKWRKQRRCSTSSIKALW
jgi:3-hydroxyisobutyrate dehydrogenase-like beta-hydroxyacid dehydrogenase